MIGEKTIYVISVERQSVQGRGRYSYVDPKGNLRPGKRSKARGVQIPIGFVPKKHSPNELDTGLDEFIDNPYYGLNIDDVAPAIRPRNNWVEKYNDIKDKQQITLQTYYEILDDVPAGTYTPVKTQEVSMSKHTIDALRTKSSTFLETFKVYLNEGTNTFTTKTSRGRLGIQAIEKSPKVANSREEVNHDIHEFYIGEKDEAAAIENTKRDKIKAAVRSLAILQDDYEFFEQYQLGVILGIVGSDTSPTLVTNKLDGYVMDEKKNRNGKQLERCEKFTNLFDKFRESKDMVYVSYLVTQAINQGLIIINAGSHYWRSKKGIDHLYNLGTDRKRIVNMFYQAFQKYEPDLEDQANLYLDLVEELRERKVLLRNY